MDPPIGPAILGLPAFSVEEELAEVLTGVGSVSILRAGERRRSTVLDCPEWSSDVEVALVGLASLHGWLDGS